MARILYTTPVLAYPAAGGPSLRVKNSIITLDKISELHVVARLPLESTDGIIAQEFYKRHCRSLSFSPSTDPAEQNRGSKCARLQVILRMKESLLTRDSAFILRYVREHSIDIVWCGYGNISFELIRALKQEEPTLKVVCDTDSVWSRYVLRGLPFERSLARKAQIYRAGKKKEQEERMWVNLADVTTAVSEVDAAYYRALAKEPNRIKIFSNVIDLDAYQRPPARDCSHLKPFIYLAGTFWPGSPMDDAAQWLVHHVLPIVKRKIPHVRLIIVGSGSSETLSEITAPNVSIAGKVKTVLPYLYNADVSAVPLFFESGTRFKILEAGACGIPVVSTTLGAEGIPVTHGKDILLADSPTAFAESIIKLICDKELAQQIAFNLQTLVQARFSIAALHDEAEHIIRVLT